MREEPDPDTVRAAREGDAPAFRRIVEAYQHKVHDLLAKMLVGVVSVAEVEDLAQDTFLRIYRALPAFEPAGPGRLTTWVLTIATRVGIDVLRKRGLRLVPLDEEQTAAPPVDDPATTRFLSSTIARGVAALPHDQRAVVVLREYYDFDYAEIAAALGIEPGTVKSRLSRARAVLRKLLEEAGYGK